jgi:hypothetical protein
MKKFLLHLKYVWIALGTVLFWRAVWHSIDRIPGINDSVFFDITTGILGLLILWRVSKGLHNLD